MDGFTSNLVKGLSGAMDNEVVQNDQTNGTNGANNVSSSNPFDNFGLTVTGATESLKSGLDQSNDSLVNKMDDFQDGVDEFGKDVNDRLHDYRDDFSEKAQHISDDMQSFGDKTNDQLHDKMDNFGDKMDNFGDKMENFGDKMENFGDNIPEKTDQMKASLSENTDQFGENMNKLSDSVSDSFTEDTENFKGNMNNFAENMSERVKSLEEQTDYIKEGFRDRTQDYTDNVYDYRNTVSENISDSVVKFGENVEEMDDSISGKEQQLQYGEKIGEDDFDMKQSLEEKAENFEERLSEKSQNLTEDIDNFRDNVFAKEENLHEICHNVVDNLSEKIQDLNESIGSNISEQMDKNVEELEPNFQECGDNILTGKKEMDDNVHVEVAESFIENLSDKTPEVRQNVESFGGSASDEVPEIQEDYSSMVEHVVEEDDDVKENIGAFGGQATETTENMELELQQEIKDEISDRSLNVSRDSEQFGEEQVMEPQETLEIRSEEVGSFMNHGNEMGSANSEKLDDFARGASDHTNEVIEKSEDFKSGMEENVCNAFGEFDEAHINSVSDFETLKSADPENSQIVDSRAEPREAFVEELSDTESVSSEETGVVEIDEEEPGREPFMEDSYGPDFGQKFTETESISGGYISKEGGNDAPFLQKTIDTESCQKEEQFDQDEEISKKEEGVDSEENVRYETIQNPDQEDDDTCVKLSKEEEDIQEQLESFKEQEEDVQGFMDVEKHQREQDLVQEDNIETETSKNDTNMASKDDLIEDRGQFSTDRVPVEADNFPKEDAFVQESEDSELALRNEKFIQEEEPTTIMTGGIIEKEEQFVPEEDEVEEDDHTEDEDEVSIASEKESEGFVHLSGDLASLKDQIVDTGSEFMQAAQETAGNVSDTVMNVLGLETGQRPAMVLEEEDRIESPETAQLTPENDGTSIDIMSSSMYGTEQIESAVDDAVDQQYEQEMLEEVERVDSPDEDVQAMNIVNAGANLDIMSSSMYEPEIDNNVAVNESDDAVTEAAHDTGTDLMTSSMYEPEMDDEVLNNGRHLAEEEAVQGSNDNDLMTSSLYKPSQDEMIGEMDSEQSSPQSVEEVLHKTRIEPESHFETEQASLQRDDEIISESEVETEQHLEESNMEETKINEIVKHEEAASVIPILHTDPTQEQLSTLLDSKVLEQLPPQVEQIPVVIEDVHETPLVPPAPEPIEKPSSEESTPTKKTSSKDSTTSPKKTISPPKKLETSTKKIMKSAEKGLKSPEKTLKSPDKMLKKTALTPTKPLTNGIGDKKKITASVTDRLSQPKMRSDLPSPSQEATPRSRPRTVQSRRSAGQTPGYLAGTLSSKSCERKKYGTDNKNEGYKPGGGNVKIFNEKRQVKATSKVNAGTPSSQAPAKRTPTPRTPPISTPSPKPTNIKSKIGSLEKTHHTPGGGNVKIMDKKTDYKGVSSKIGSKDKIDHKPGGGNVKIENKKIEISKVKSKIGSMDNAKHKATGGDKKIESKKLEWKTESKIGSMDNATHKAGGGEKKIHDEKVDYASNATSKCGSLDNADHVPGGGQQ